MKKAFYIILGVILFAMFVSNTSETEFLNIIENSRDPSAQHGMLRIFKNATPIVEGGGKFFSPVFNMNFTNLGLFSVANVESGWAGTLRIDGKHLDEFVDKVSKEQYLLIFGMEYKL